jgi:hypothetical protein
MLHPCAHPACRTLTLGRFCLAHEIPVRRAFTRGRPFVRLLPEPDATPWFEDELTHVGVAVRSGVPIRA